MARWLVPDEYLPSVYAMDLDALWSRGIRGIVFDLDNTLVRWDVADPSEPLKRWLEEVRDRGFRVCIVSNNRRDRVQAFARQLDVPGIAKAVKPSRRSLRRALEVMGTRPAETAVVGDQLFTDVLAGRRLGLYTIMVAPVGAREFVGTRLVRRLERLWLAYLRRRGLLATRSGG